MLSKMGYRPPSCEPDALQVKRPSKTAATISLRLPKAFFAGDAADAATATAARGFPV